MAPSWYDPVTQVWSPTGALTVGRFGHTANLLPDGKVLVVGGFVASGKANSAEVYDPATGTWAPTGSLFYDRTADMHRATTLQDGNVVVTGGYVNDTSGHSLPNVERYDPTRANFYTVGPLNVARRYHASVLLPNGKVLVAGGGQERRRLVHRASAEVYNASTLVWTPVASLNVPRSGHTMTLLPNGKVLVAGGSSDASASLASAELFDSATACSAITVYPATLPPLTSGVPYSQTFEQSGSSGAVVWAVGAGALPGGLGLDAGTGVLSGTPASSAYDFTVRVYNGNCFGARAYTTVVKIATTTTLTASDNPVFNGDMVTMTARVSTADGGTPTGRVRFSHGRYLRSFAWLVGGVATFDMVASDLGVPGQFYVVASYFGDETYQPSSDTLTLEVY